MSSPTLTKKDFERIAETLRDLQGATVAIASDGLPGSDARISRAFRHACADIAEVIAKTNGKFELTRFIEACEVQ
jgi:hypothetical protein